MNDAWKTIPAHKSGTAIKEYSFQCFDRHSENNVMASSTQTKLNSLEFFSEIYDICRPRMLRVLQLRSFPIGSFPVVRGEGLLSGKQIVED